jgi:HlyD family type I secretion membrane fusion protein
MEHSNQIPRDILSPLYRAALALCLFLALAGIWATFAPLATSIPLSGRIVSDSPAFALQHPYGGQIFKVHVAKHDEVKQGQTLIEFDSALDRENLIALEAMRDRFQQDNSAITAILEGGTPVPDGEYALRHDHAQLQQSLQALTAASLDRQIEALQGKDRHDRAQLDLLRARAQRQADLVRDGIITRTDSEALETRILRLEGSVLSTAAQLHRLRESLDQAQHQPELTLLTLRAELSGIRSANERRLEELRQSIANLRDRIARATVTAPISGTVTDLLFEAEGMYAGQGATLISLSRPLEAPHISFTVPTALIDQLRPGMTGKLMIPSLPQRSMPNMRITVQAISPRAEREEEGAPQVYSGLASLAPDALSELQQVFGPDFTLSEDMPVNLMIEGRQTTLVQYLIAPFWASFNHALQD